MRGRTFLLSLRQTEEAFVPECTKFCREKKSRTGEVTKNFPAEVQGLRDERSLSRHDIEERLDPVSDSFHEPRLSVKLDWGGHLSFHSFPPGPRPVTTGSGTSTSPLRDSSLSFLFLRCVLCFSAVLLVEVRSSTTLSLYCSCELPSLELTDV